MAPTEVIEEVALSGLRGRGGAGFPTATKWTALHTGTGPRYVVCNAAEGEPATFKDRLLIRRNPYRVIDGIQIGCHATGAQKAYVGLKEAFTKEFEALSRALEEMERADALPVGVELIAGPDHSLLGEETGLLEVIENREPLPRVARPYYWGLFAKPPDENPTAVNNVETLSNVAHILAEGPDWLRQWGTEASPGTMCFTVAGDTSHEGVWELPMGTTLRDLLEAAGGVRGGGEVKVIFPGASSTALVESQLDTPLSFEAMAAVGSGLGAGGFAVYDERTCVVEPLEALQRGDPEADLDEALARARGATDGQKCALPTGTSLLMQSLFLTFEEEFRSHAGRECPSPRGLVLPKIVDWDEDAGRFTYDERYVKKRPDWTYA